MPQRITLQELLALTQRGVVPETPTEDGPRFRTEDGELHKGYPTAEQSGGFYGKAGGFRRSRKGQPRRMPNGSRRYNDVGSTVLYYVPKRVV